MFYLVQNLLPEKFWYQVRVIIISHWAAADDLHMLIHHCACADRQMLLSAQWIMITYAHHDSSTTFFRLFTQVRLSSSCIIWCLLECSATGKVAMRHNYSTHHVYTCSVAHWAKTDVCTHRLLLAIMIVYCRIFLKLKTAILIIRYRYVSVYVKLVMHRM